MSHLRPRVVQR